MTRPLKTWTRSLSPSLIFTPTSTTSPTSKGGCFFMSFVRRASTELRRSFMFAAIGSLRCLVLLVEEVRSSRACPSQSLFLAPFLDCAVVAREQHVRHAHPAERP